MSEKISFRESIITHVRTGLVLSTLAQTLITLLLAVAWTNRNIENEVTGIGRQLSPEFAGALNVDNTVAIVGRLQGLVQRKPIVAARVLGPQLELSASAAGRAPGTPSARFVTRSFPLPTAQSVKGDYALIIVADRLSYWPQIALAMLAILSLGVLTYLVLTKYVNAAARKIGAPIAELSAHLERDGLVSAIDGHESMEIAEISVMMRALSDAQTRLFDVQDKIREAEVDKSLYQLASQVAHDIRSPLAALDGAIGDAGQMPEDQLSLVRTATGRIRDIANDLLDMRRDRRGTAPPTIQSLAAVIEPLIAEKQMQYRSKPGVRIECRIVDEARRISARINSAQFARALSNVVNNSIEALGDAPGRVATSLSIQDGDALVKIEDDGKGIPPHILERLGRDGETHGKEGGSGLGLYHAKSSIESWGGRFEIQSEAGKGTRVIFRIPIVATDGPRRTASVLIDDDPLVQKVWLMVAKSKGVPLAVFSSPAEFDSSTEVANTASTIFIDSELADGVKGEEFAERLHTRGFANLYLATGKSPDSFPPMPWIKGVVGKEAPWR